VLPAGEHTLRVCWQLSIAWLLTLLIPSRLVKGEAIKEAINTIPGADVYDAQSTRVAGPTPPEVPIPPPPEELREIPAWVTPQPKSSRLWIYLTGLLLIVVIAGGGIWVRGQILANQAADQGAAVSPPPRLLSDHERADRFINVQLTPVFAALVTPLQGVERDCNPRAMTAPCKPDLIATNQAMIAGDDVLNRQRDIPACIAREVNQFKYDWQGMEQGVGLAISGYNDNSYDLYLQGMVKFAEIAQYIKPDMDRITTAEKTCSQTP